MVSDQILKTDAKGNLLSYSRDPSTNYSDRILVINVDNHTVSNDNAFNVAYVYFNYSTEDTDRSVSTTITSAKNAYIMLSAPHSRVVSINSAENAVELPAQTFIKSSSEEIHVFFVFNRYLAHRIEDYNERADEEGLNYIKLASLDSSGTDSLERYTLSNTRFGNGFIRAKFKGGSDNTDYAILCRIYTTFEQVLEARAILRIKNLLPE